MTKSQGEMAVLGFFSINNALYSISFGIHTKTVEMPFGVMNRLGQRNSVLRGGDDS